MFEELLEKLASVLAKAHIPYMVVGGQAVLLHGEPRLTRDIDITLGITTEQIDRFMPLVKIMGLEALVDPHDFTRETMVLPCQDTRSDIRVDFIFSFSPYERQAIERACAVKMGKAQVMFASVEDLVVHKVFTARPPPCALLHLPATPQLTAPCLRAEMNKHWSLSRQRAPLYDSGFDI